jgi:hypothetical protein
MYAERTIIVRCLIVRHRTIITTVLLLYALHTIIAADRLILVRSYDYVLLGNFGVSSHCSHIVRLLNAIRYSLHSNYVCRIRSLVSCVLLCHVRTNFKWCATLVRRPIFDFTDGNGTSYESYHILFSYAAYDFRCRAYVYGTTYNFYHAWNWMYPTIVLRRTFVA